MRVFVTGATGWVGLAVVQDLIAAGHQVVGLARSDAGADAVAAAGAEVLRGSMEDQAGLRRGAENADGVIHCAFNHDWSRFAENCEQDRQTIETLGEALAGSARPLLVTSGVAFLSPGRIATETESPITAAPAYGRVSEHTAAALAAKGVRASVVRLPPSVHGHGDHGFVPRLIEIAREKGVSAYSGDGGHRWPSVHRLDAARAYRLALEHAATGAAWHAIAEIGVPFKAIAEVIGRRLGLPVVGMTPEEASEHFGWFAMFAGMDVPASGEHTQAVLGWTPRGPGLIEDLDHPAYFPA